jgi:dimethylamine monooxygenase subunit A
MPLHTPYDGSAKPFTIGLKPLDLSTWLEPDEFLVDYLTEKIRLYEAERSNVIVAEAGTEAAQAEVLATILAHTENVTPHLYRRAGYEIWIADSVVVPLDNTSLPQIATAGLLVQEDLVLMRQSTEGWRLVAASLCFPSAWNLLEKFGKPMASIHTPVPGFGPGTRNASLIDRMFDNLRVEQPVIRWNWSFYGDDKLYHPASDNRMKNRFGEGAITGKVFMRLERQTLRKLPASGDILFTIRIHNNPLEVLANHPDGKSLAKAMAEQMASLTPDEISYKGLVGEHERLLARIMDFA